jgi:hypothetical protein
MTPNPIVISLCRHSSFKKSLNGEQWNQSKERDYTKSKNTYYSRGCPFLYFPGVCLYAKSRFSDVLNSYKQADIQLSKEATNYFFSAIAFLRCSHWGSVQYRDVSIGATGRHLNFQIPYYSTIGVVTTTFCLWLRPCSNPHYC